MGPYIGHSNLNSWPLLLERGSDALRNWIPLAWQPLAFIIPVGLLVPLINKFSKIKKIIYLFLLTNKQKKLIVIYKLGIYLFYGILVGARVVTKWQVREELCFRDKMREKTLMLLYVSGHALLYFILELKVLKNLISNN